MAESDRLFQDALKRGSAHAWNGRWEKAADEYRLALEQSPEDLSARTYLAMALYRGGRFEEALELYHLLWKAQTANLSMLQRIAELEEALGHRESAAASYRVLAEVYTRRGSAWEALKAWQKVVEFEPGNPQCWGPLIDVAIQVGALSTVLPGYLELARLLALQCRFEDAIQVAERAQKLDPANPVVLPLLAAIRRGLQYSWRAASMEEEPHPEDLARLIPSIQVLQQRHIEAEPAEQLIPTTQTVEPEVTQPEVTQEEPPSPTPESSHQPESARAESFRPEQPDVVDIEQRTAEEMPEELEATTSTAEAVEERESQELVDALRDVDEAPVQDDVGSLPTTAEAQDRGDEIGTEYAPPETWLPEGPEADMEQRPALEWHGQAEDVEPAPADAMEREPTEADQPEARQPESVEADAEAEGPDRSDAVSPEQVGTEEPEVPQAPEEEGEEGAGLTWEELVRRAQEARRSGKLKDAISLFEESIASGAAIAQQFVELAEVHEQLGQMEQAITAYEQALGLAPDLPEALLGMARFHLSARQLDDADEKVRRLLEMSGTDADEARLQSAELLLDILRERAAYGDLGAAADSLAWLRFRVGADRLPAAVMERSAEVASDLLGECASEHLEEIASLPPQARGEIVLALRKAEGQLGEGLLRAAADEMHRLVEVHPDFLPAQSMLGRILVAQGKVDEARERSKRLVHLYEARGVPTQALEVLWWTVTQEIANGVARDQLVELLRAQNRVKDAELVEAGLWASRRPTPIAPPVEPVPSHQATGPWFPEELLLEVSGAEMEPADESLQEAAPVGPEMAKELPWEVSWTELGATEESFQEAPATDLEPAEEPFEEADGIGQSQPAEESPMVGDPDRAETPEAETGTEMPTRDALVRLAESRFALGDRNGAMKLVQAALKEDGVVDDAIRASLIRIMQVMEPSPELRDELARLLKRLGLPEELAG